MTVATAVAAGAGAGAGATATLVAGSNDERGEVSVTTAGTPAAGILATITFAGSWQGVGSQLGGPFVNLTANATNTLAGALATLSFQWNAAKTTLSIYCTGTPVTATTYLVDYNITG